MYYLVSFVEEGTVSVVKEGQIIGEKTVGEEVLVKWGKSNYPARVDAIGKNKKWEH